MRVLGLVGTRGAGKDTFADALGFPAFAFAQPIKDACEAIFMAGAEAFEDRVIKETVDERWGVSPREMLQILGTECVRGHFGEDHWIRHMEMQLQRCESESVVITDVRFPDEAAFVRRLGGRLVRIVRPTLRTDDAHVSETGIGGIECDEIIVNDGSIQDIREKAAKFTFFCTRNAASTSSTHSHTTAHRLQMDSLVTFKCRDLAVQVPIATLAAVPALQAMATGSFADGASLNGGVVEVHRHPETCKAFLSFVVTQEVPAGPVTPALLAELDFWGAAFAAPLSRTFRPSEEALAAIRADVDAFADWVAHTALDLSGDQCLREPPCAAVLQLPCAKYLHDDRWGEEVDAFKYTVSHPQQFRAAMLQRWGLDATWSEPTSAVARVTHDSSPEVFVGALPLLVCKDWSEWDACPGAFGIPARAHVDLLDHAVAPYVHNHAAVRLRTGTAHTLRAQASKYTGEDRPSLRCAMQHAAPMQFVDLHVFLFKTEEEAQMWKAYMGKIRPDECAGLALSDSDGCPFPHQTVRNVHDTIVPIEKCEEGLAFVGFAAVSSCPQALCITQHVLEARKQQYVGPARVCQVTVRMVI
ncbi:hypothetical protein JKP88DRAFT_273090 [Tribonema minus]|uniref:Phosphomevalonate kinase n=1 Tax=Tribonema minus TaxID=303371 RepID=A0A836CE54_9STRA|nr:hypothetical protein JKP88DRAFT_273090 [Tribonema minus]